MTSSKRPLGLTDTPAPAPARAGRPIRACAFALTLLSFLITGVTQVAFGSTAGAATTPAAAVGRVQRPAVEPVAPATPKARVTSHARHSRRHAQPRAHKQPASAPTTTVTAAAAPAPVKSTTTTTHHHAATTQPTHTATHASGPTDWPELNDAIARIPTYRKGAARWVIQPGSHWGTADWYTDVIYVTRSIPVADLYSVAAHEWSHLLSVHDYDGDVSAAVAAMHKYFGGSGLLGAERAADCMAILQGATWTAYTSCTDSTWRAGARRLLNGKKLLV